MTTKFLIVITFLEYGYRIQRFCDLVVLITILRGMTSDIIGAPKNFFLLILSLKFLKERQLNKKNWLSFIINDSPFHLNIRFSYLVFSKYTITYIAI